MPKLDDTPLINRLARYARESPDDLAFTFMDYTTEIDGTPVRLTWAQLDRRARRVAAALRAVSEPGQRAAILAPQTHDYVVAFLGAMYARLIGVPLFSPDLPGHAERLLAVYTDADPECVITTSAALPHVEAFLNGNPVPRPKQIVVADTIDQDGDQGGHGGRSGEDADWTAEPIAPDDVAYLQYTSGSTRVPAGVMITHGNFATNGEQLWRHFDGRPRESTAVNWLPLFHDMGLVTTVALPLVHGNPCVLMDPVAFIMRPVRWLEVLSEHPHTFTGGPNFSYEYLAAQATDEDKRKLDLSGVQVFMNGAEPIRTSTLDHFHEAFRDCGLRKEAQVAAYGLAETTVFVAASTQHRPATRTSFDKDALRDGVAVPCPPDSPEATLLVACGTPTGQHVAIVDPETGVRRPDGRTGEIWVHGPNVAVGYWGRPEVTKETFQATLAEPVDGLPEGPWLRTGDLGIWHEGELYVTGRIKDLIIVDGRNHYPQDIEYTTYSAHKALRRDYAAAFAINAGETEGVVVIAERNRRVPIAHLDLEEIAQSVRSAVQAGHDLSLRDFVLIEPGTLPRTSSGKVARSAGRQAYLDGALQVTELPTA